jgi:hypothetical protein
MQPADCMAEGLPRPSDRHLMTNNSRQSYRRAPVGGGSGNGWGGLAEMVRTCVESLLMAVSRWWVAAPPAHGGISSRIYNELSKKIFYECSNIDFSNRIVFGIQIFE